MTERDLWRYRDAKRAYKVAMEKLKEYEATIYAPNTQDLSGMPHDEFCSPDKMAAVADRHAKLILDTLDAAKRVAECDAMLADVERRLTAEEGEFVHNRYRLGLNRKKIAKKMHYSERSLTRIRREILKQIYKVVP